MSVLGTTEPDLISALLGTGYTQFESPTGMNGLAKTNEARLDILAVSATIPGTGQFRNFIDKCKDEFQTICVWEVWNPLVEQALKRYGFHETQATDVDTLEYLDGWRWDRND